MALNLGAIPVGVALFALHGALPLDGLVANVVWAAVNGGLAAAVLSFTLGLQRHQRVDYRFPVPLVAELVFADSSRVLGTADDISATGLRFYGALPSTLATGQPVTGQLLLPDGPIALWGEVAASFGAADDSDGPRAVGCRVRSTGDGQRRLETFLFGSDRQWQVNGYSDQVHTPLSRWLPRRVAGPQAHPLVGRRWNAAQVHARIDEPGLPALAAAGELAGSENLLLSYLPLPTDAPLVLQVFRRTAVPPRGVRLEPLPLPGSDVFAYRLTGVPLPLARRQDNADTQPAALLMREAIEQARSDVPGEASPHDAQPSTL
jgi:cellulose synthase (UDP-forming)